MPSALTTLRRRAKALHRNLRGAAMAARALASTDHPLLAHIIPVRRCNLACTYCNEFDDFSKPVPTEEMFRRIDKLGALGTAVVTISGGEPLLHPELDDVIRRIRSNGMIAGLITNGYFLVAERIQRLNRAGLEWLQISIDNVNPDEVSKKSLKVLDKKLQLLAEHAEFHVNINSVVGGGISNPQDALTIGKRAIELGFQLDHRHHSRRQRPVAAAGRGRAPHLSRDEVDGEAQLHPHQRLPGQHRAGPAERLALPRRRALSLHLRRRTGALLLAAARLSRQCRSQPTPATTCAANTSPKNPARRTARFPACIRFRSSMAGAPRSIPRRMSASHGANSCRSGSASRADSHEAPRDYFFGCADGGKTPFNRKYIAAAA